VKSWTETDSTTFNAIADVAVPRRVEMRRALVTAVPFAPDDSFRIVELGAGDGRLAADLLHRFPHATVTALDGSESMRAEASARLASFQDRARVAPADIASLDWWDALFGVDLVISSLALHHLNDARKQYVYKAVADRTSSRAVLLVADLVEPMDVHVRARAADEWDAAARAQADAAGQPDLYDRFVAERWNHFRFPDAADQPSALFHHLVWLRHAGFAAVDCVWLFAGHAVFGGYKSRG